MNMKRLLAAVLFLCLLPNYIPPVQTNAATTEGYYTYEIVDGNATITDCDRYISGDITIPSILDGYPVTEIGDSAFYNCTNLISVTIPNSVTSIGNGTFDWCDSLTGIWVDENNPNYSSDAYGVLFNKNKTELIQAPMNLSGDYSISESIEHIGIGAFAGCEKLTSVTIGCNVKIIDEGAFYECNGLTFVDIPDNVNSIEAAAFSTCGNLRSVMIGSGVINVGNGAFAYCNRLQEIRIAEDSVNYSNDNYGVLFNKEKTRLIQMPGGITGNYPVPMGVINIGQDAFNGSNLTSVEFPDSLQVIEDGAFWGCSKLTSIVIPNNVNRIGYNVFNSCNSLTSVTLGTKLTMICGGAFQYCSNLTAIVIPASVMNIDSTAFHGAAKNGIWVDESNPYYSSDGRGVLFDKDKTELLQVPGGISGSYTIPSTVVNISDFAFFECSSLTEVTIPNSVVNIGNGAFWRCTGLTTVSIPDSVISIGDIAFLEADNLENVRFYGNAPSISDYTFEGITATAYYPINNDTWTDELKMNYGGELTWVAYEDDESILATGLCGKDQTWSLTSEGVLRISGTGDMYDFEHGEQPWYAFMNEIKCVIVEHGVISVGDYAFNGCAATSIVFERSVTEIGNKALGSCPNVEYVVFQYNPPVFQKETFASTRTTVYYPADYAQWIPVIGQNYGGLLTWNPVQGSDGMEEIASGICGDDVTWAVTQGGFLILSGVGPMWDYGCMSARQEDANTPWHEYNDLILALKIENGVTTIGNNAFHDCKELMQTALPKSVTHIGDGAFDKCTSLDRVIYCGADTQWNAISIGNGNTYLTNAQRRYHDYNTYDFCTICGDEVSHAHTWEEGACTNCAQQLVEAIDLDSDGRITAFDAQVLAEATAGLRTLTEEQWSALGDLKSNDIRDYVLGRFQKAAITE